MVIYSENYHYNQYVIIIRNFAQQRIQKFYVVRINTITTKSSLDVCYSYLLDVVEYDQNGLHV